MIVLGYLAHNLTVSYAAGLLVLMKLVLPEEKIDVFQQPRRELGGYAADGGFDGAHRHGQDRPF